MRTVTFDEPQQWIFVDVRGVPEARQGKLLETFAEIQDVGSRGLLRDKSTVFVLVRKTRSGKQKEEIERYLKQVLNRLDLPHAEISFSEAWSLAVTVRPFVSEPPLQRALEARLPDSVKEKDWDSSNEEVTLWTERRPSPRLQEEIRSILRW